MPASVGEAGQRRHGGRGGRLGLPLRDHAARHRPGRRRQCCTATCSSSAPAIPRSAGAPARTSRPGSQALKALGIRRIDGRIIGDDDAIEEPRPQLAWAWDDLGYTTGAIFGALNLAENRMTVTVTPGADRRRDRPALGVEPRRGVPSAREPRRHRRAGLDAAALARAAARRTVPDDRRLDPGRRAARTPVGLRRQPDALVRERAPEPAAQRRASRSPATRSTSTTCMPRPDMRGVNACSTRYRSRAALGDRPAAAQGEHQPVRRGGDAARTPRRARFPPTTRRSTGCARGWRRGAFRPTRSSSSTARDCRAATSSRRRRCSPCCGGCTTASGIVAVRDRPCRSPASDGSLAGPDDGHCGRRATCAQRPARCRTSARWPAT